MLSIPAAWFQTMYSKNSYWSSQKIVFHIIWKLPFASWEHFIMNWLTEIVLDYIKSYIFFPSPSNVTISTMQVLLWQQRYAAPGHTSGLCLSRYRYLSKHWPFVNFAEPERNGYPLWVGRAVRVFYMKQQKCQINSISQRLCECLPLTWIFHPRLSLTTTPFIF